LIVLEECPGIVDVIILCGILKGDPSPSSSRPLGLTVIQSFARATSVVTPRGAAPPPPPPHGVKELILFVISYFFFVLPFL